MTCETKALSAMHQSMKSKEIEETEAIYVSPQKRQVRLGTADECGAFDDLTFSTVPRVHGAMRVCGRQRRCQIEQARKATDRQRRPTQGGEEADKRWPDSLKRP